VSVVEDGSFVRLEREKRVLTAVLAAVHVFHAPRGLVAGDPHL
jgi:hypothetical protein